MEEEEEEINGPNNIKDVSSSENNFNNSVNCINSISTKCSSSISTSNNNLNSFNANNTSTSLNGSIPVIVDSSLNDKSLNNISTLANNNNVIPSNKSLNLNLKNLECLKNSSNSSSNNISSIPLPQNNQGNVVSTNHNPPPPPQNTDINCIFSSQQDYLNFSGEYLNDIYFNLLSEERNILPKPIYGYMNKQTDINEKIRAILVDLFIEIQGRFNLDNQTIYRTVFILDTYLSLRFIQLKYFQLLGFGCLLIACKSQEIFFPKATEILSTTDNNYTKEDLLLMETEILGALNYGVFSPTPEEYYNIIAKIFKFKSEQYYFGKYFMESSLLDYNMIKYPPSVIAVTCCYIVMKFFGMQNYKSLYSNHFLLRTYPQKIIKEAAKKICFFVKELSVSQELRSVRDKYSNDKFLRVAKLSQ